MENVSLGIFFCRQNIKIITKMLLSRQQSKAKLVCQWHLIFHPDLNQVKRRCKRPSSELISSHNFCILNANFLLVRFIFYVSLMHMCMWMWHRRTLWAICETLPSLWAHCRRLKAASTREISLLRHYQRAKTTLFLPFRAPTHFVYFREKKYSFLNILLLPLNLSIPFNNEAFLLRL